MKDSVKNILVFLGLLGVLGLIPALLIWGFGFKTVAGIVIGFVCIKAKISSATRAKKEMDEKAAKEQKQ